MPAATGIAVAFAFMHGLARGGATTIDNFWTDVTRVPVYLLLPACIVLTLVYVALGDAQPGAFRAMARTST